MCKRERGRYEITRFIFNRNIFSQKTKIDLDRTRERAFVNDELKKIAIKRICTQNRHTQTARKMSTIVDDARTKRK